jgi:RND family efflux transporter MFP subunit
VAAPVAGLLSEVRCAEGERVLEGALLFHLDSRVADVAVNKARQALPFAEAAFERQKALGLGEATSQRQYQEAELAVAAARNDLASAEALRALLDVRAPLAGTVAKLNARPGDAVDPTTLLAEIIDLERLVVSAVVRSSEVGRVRPGQVIELSARGPASARDAVVVDAHGTVVFVGAQVDSRTDSVAVRASVPAGAGLRPGQLLTVRICTAERKDRLAVPVEALVTEAGASTIAVVTGDRAVKRPVKPGLRDGPLVEVEGEGLREGLTVVAAGAYGLPRESRIRVLGR